MVTPAPLASVCAPFLPAGSLRAEILLPEWMWKVEQE